MPSQPVPAALCHGLRDCVLASVTLPPAPVAKGPLLAALALPDEASPDAVGLIERPRAFFVSRKTPQPPNITRIYASSNTP